MSKTESQEKQILAYMQAGKSITPLEALNIFGCFRLGARIYDMGRRGIEVKSEFVTLPSGKRVKKYWV